MNTKREKAEAWSFVVRSLALSGGREKVTVFEHELKANKARGWKLGIRLATSGGYLRRDGDEYTLTQKAYDHFSQQFERDYQAHLERVEREAPTAA